MCNNPDNRGNNVINADTPLSYFVEVGRLNNRIYRRLLSNGMNTLGDVIEYNNSGRYFRDLNGFGRGSEDTMIAFLNDNRIVEGDNTEVNNDVRERATFAIVDQYFSSYKRDLLRARYDAEFETLPARCITYRRNNMPTFEECLDLMDATRERYPNNNGNDRTITDIINFNFRFAETIREMTQWSEADFIRNFMTIEFPNMNENDMDYVFDFHERNGHFPMFFLLKHYISRGNGNERNRRIYCLSYGILDGVQHNNVGLADMFEFDRERVRQILRDFELHSAFLNKEDEWNAYSRLLDSLCIDENNQMYRNIVADEFLCDDFTAFYGLLRLKRKFKMYTINNRMILVNTDKVADKNVRSIRDLIEEQFRRQQREDTTVSIDGLLRDIPNDVRDNAARLVKYIIEKIYELNVNGDTFVIPQGRVVISHEVENILREKGTPMHLRDIMDGVNRRYPERRIDNIERLRSCMRYNKHIVAIGNQSVFGLSEWNVYRGNMKDLLRDVLMRSEEESMHYRVLFNAVLPFFPNTTQGSVYTTLSDDTNRFISYGNGYFGLNTEYNA